MRDEELGVLEEEENVEDEIGRNKEAVQVDERREKGKAEKMRRCKGGARGS